jgi:ubiquinone/menaquinone biosynthesis C-methylase UbiE
MDEHNATIVEQFTLQADAFAAAAPIRDDQALKLLVDRCGAGPLDDVLDVACGPGLVVGAFAEVAKSATGIDLTEAMISKGRALVASKNLANASFAQGDVYSMPFGDASFSIVTSRYAFHHFTEPARALQEMVRVCRPGGRVAVMDMIASEDRQKAERFNQMEKLRDPSHVAAQPLHALTRLFQQVGLSSPSVMHYKMDVELEGLLKTSFPNPGDRERVHQAVLESVQDDGMGVNSRRRGDRVFFSYPIVLLVSMVAAA